MNALDLFAAARPDVEADDGILDAIAADVFDGIPRRPSGSARWRVLAVAAAVVALVAGLAAIVGRPERTAPADTVPPVIGDDGEPLRMLPKDLDGSTVVGFLDPPDTATVWSIVLARQLDDGTYVDKVIVQRGQREELWIDTSDPETTVMRRGLSWELTDDSSVVAAQADMGDGTVLQVVLTGPGDVERGRSIVTDVAMSLSGAPQPPFGVALDPMPEGLTVVADWNTSNGRSRYVGVQGSGPLFNLVTYASGDASFAFRLMGSDLRPLAVRGTDGYASTWLGGQTLIWQERPGHWALLASADSTVTVEELVALASSLEVVTADEWDAKVEPPGTPGRGAPATTAPAFDAPGSTAPQNAPPGRLLVANATNVGGVAGQWSALFAAQGADVLDPVSAAAPDGEPAFATKIFVRAGSEALGAWVGEQFGDVTVAPFDSLDPTTIEGGVSSADVVVVVGPLHAGSALVAPGAPLVIGNSVTMGAEGELTARGYLVNAEVSRLLVDVALWIRAAVEGGRPDVVVLQLADNGPFRRADLDALLDAVSDVPNVILVNTHVDREWADPNNALLAEVDLPEDNLILMDWDSLAGQCPGECFASDGVHLTALGAEYFAELLGEITGL